MNARRFDWGRRLVDRFLTDEQWGRAGVFERIFECLSAEPDFEYALVDGTIVTAHHKAAGAKGGPGTGPSGAPAAA